MRILHVSRSAETIRAFLIPTMEAQRRLGHEVYVCAQESPQADALRRAGFEVFTHRMPRNLNPWRAYEAIRNTRRVLVGKRIDAIVCHTSLGAVVGRLAARWAGTRRVIYFVHGLACGPAQGLLDWQVRFRVEQILGTWTDAIVVMNDYDERLSRRTPLARSAAGVHRIASMGVDLNRFASGAFPEIRVRVGRELGMGPDDKLVLCVARLIPEKGVAEFVAAATRIVERRRDAFFLLAGVGPLFDALTRSVARAGVGDRVRVLGWRNDVPDLMRAADVFVLPSYFMEGLPVSVIEAMACGKPVLSTHHKGCEDAVRDGETGYLVPVKDVPALVARMGPLLDDAALRERLGRAGRRRVEQEFEIDKCTRVIVDVLERTMR